MQDDLNQKEGFHRNKAKTADVESLHQISKNLIRSSHGGSHAVRNKSLLNKLVQQLDQ